MSEDALNSFFQRVKLVDVKAGEHIVQINKPCSTVYFVIEGLLKYVMSVEGEERVMHIASQGDLVTDFYSYLSGGTSNSTIVTVTDCKLASITRAQMEELFAAYKDWERFGRIAAEQAVLTQIRETIRLKTKSREEIYLDFLAQKPAILQQVKLGDLAQSLGMAQETLSRIRKKISQR